MGEEKHVDVVILGGGAAGLWVLDELHHGGFSAMVLEAGELGAGQTVVSQGIIHGGTKYSLSGLVSRSARAIRDMPRIWRRCIAGEGSPNLVGTRLRAEFCHLWRTDSIASRLAMIGARAALRVAPVSVPDEERPSVLADCPGTVARLNEQVIEPASFIALLSQRHDERILKIDASSGLEFVQSQPGQVDLIRLINPDTGEPLDIHARWVVLTAGEGNQKLRARLELSSDAMQRRPLHMVMVRGDLPWLNGHCVDGSATRVTITSTRDCGDRTVWQIGGQIAEDGVRMECPALVARAQSELQEVLPGIDLDGLEWSTYRADRAEPSTRGGLRPQDAFASRHGNVITAWPTKLALVPRLSQRVHEQVGEPAANHEPAHRPANWPRPVVALPPWETETQWYTDL